MVKENFRLKQKVGSNLFHSPTITKLKANYSNIFTDQHVIKFYICGLTSFSVFLFCLPVHPNVSQGCQGGCATCSDYNGCLSCKPRLFFVLERIGMKQIGVCLSSCPSGYYGTRYPDINKCTSKYPYHFIFLSHPLEFLLIKWASNQTKVLKNK